MIYIIGITSYDNDHQLWETHIGLNRNKSLQYSTWAQTEEESKEKAKHLIDFLHYSVGITNRVS